MQTQARVVYRAAVAAKLFMEIINITEQHYPAIKRIYLQGIATGNATFQTDAPDWNHWDKSHLQTCRLVLIENNNVSGWAALSPVSSRCVYAGVAEVSVYIDETQRGKGFGKILLLELIRQSEAVGLWTLQSGIFPENISSIKVHEACGFRMIGYRERVGQMSGVWRNNVFMERRSNTVGI